MTRSVDVLLRMRPRLVACALVAGFVSSASAHEPQFQPPSPFSLTGSALGGGTFWGLIRLLVPNVGSGYAPTAWEEIQRCSADGDNENVDLLVGDIYGEEDEKYSRLGLSKTIIASSFGKVSTTDFDDGGDVRSHYRSEDIVRSLLFMMANNIGQIAYLVAEQQKIERVFFAGGLIEDSTILWNKLSFAINFWSKGLMKALFLRHNGYLGALGAIIGESGHLSPSSHPDSSSSSSPSSFPSPTSSPPPPSSSTRPPGASQ